MTRHDLTTFLLAVLFAALPGWAQAQGEAAETGYVEIEGVNYHYQVHGEGEPLLLLHGGLGQFDMFEPILPALTAQRQVIGVDLQGHGRTPLGDRPLDIADMGRDMAELVRQLGHDQVDVMGYSMGAGVAAQMAVQHPDAVRRLVLVSATFSKDGFYPGIVEQMHEIDAEMAPAMRDTPMYQSYVAVAPRPEDFPRLLDAMGEMMRQPDIYALEVERLTTPVMLVYGDADMFRLDHIVEFYRRLGGGQGDAGWMRENMPQNRLAILPDLTHYEIFASPILVPIALPFLDGESPSISWADQVETGK